MTNPDRVPRDADLVIVGAGIMGLSIAYNVAIRCSSGDAARILVVDRGYMAEGASGRNGGGIRQQWSTEKHIVLMRRSIELCRRFARDFRINNWFRQGGYLFLARTLQDAARLEENVTRQNRQDIATTLLTPSQAKRLVPELSTEGLVSGCYNPSDGILFPWPFLWGYARKAEERGVKIYLHTPVTNIESIATGYRVVTPRGTVDTPRIVNACGAWSKDLAALVGLTVPTRPRRHEICSSEPLKPFLTPMVSELGSGLYVSQSMRGELVGGVSLGHEESSLSLGSRLRFTRRYAQHLLRLFPILGDVKILRQWAGPYDDSPDGNPIVGCPTTHPNFFLACGFVGHGFMMAPVVGELYGELLARGQSAPFFADYCLERFTNGTNLVVEDFNIG